MLVFEELRLRNYALFADQDFTFEPGLTVIGGRNRVGKSLLFSAIRSLLFGVSTGEHMPKGSHVELDLQLIRSASKPLSMSIIADSPKTKPDWQLLINKKDMRTHRKRSVRDLIDRNINLTEDLFDSTCHLSINPRSMPLFMGTPAAKLDWLASVFNLSSIYSQAEGKVSELLQQLHKDEVRLDVLTKSLRDIPEKPDLVKLEKLQARHKALKSKIAIWSEKHQLQEERAALQSLIKAMRKRRTKLKALNEIEQRIDELKAQQRLLEKHASEIDDYREQLREYKFALAKRQELMQKLPDEVRPKSNKHLRQLISEWSNRQRKLEERLRRRDTHERDYQRWVRDKRELKQLSRPTMNVEEAEYKVAEESEQLSAAKGILHNLEHTAKRERVCPQCGSELNKQHVRSLHEQYNKRIAQTKKRLSEAKQAQRWHELSESVRDRVEKVDWDSLEKKLAQANKYLRIMHDLEEGADLIAPDKPKAIKAKLPDRKVVEAELDDLRNDRAIFEAHGRDTFPPLHELELRLEELQGELKDTPEDKVENLSDQAMEIAETIHAIKLQQQSYISAKKHNNELQEEIAALQKRCRVIRPLRALKDAFGRSGIMLNSLNDAIEHLLQEINTLVPMLLDEKFRVDIVTGPRKLNVNIERNGRVESLRTLSTSEQRCWALLFATAMLTILPNSMLTDTIILDELESNMDAISRKRYATEFLPFLQTIVPKVVVVTPQISGEMVLQPDRAFRVEKHNNVSSLRQIA